MTDSTFQDAVGRRDEAAGTTEQQSSQSPTFGGPERDADPIVCPRCNDALEHLGTRRFHEGANWGILGDLGELFVKHERLDIYACRRCGRVEFFVDGLGEQYRPQ